MTRLGPATRLRTISGINPFLQLAFALRNDSRPQRWQDLFPSSVRETADVWREIRFLGYQPADEIPAPNKVQAEIFERFLAEVEHSVRNDQGC